MPIDWMNALQWPAMGITVLAAWLVANASDRSRRAGFWLYLVSNALWVGWGLYTSSYALVCLQFALAVMNVRGERKAAA